MAWFDPTTWGKKTELQERSSGSFPYGIPEKVFIEREAGNYEYSEIEPANVKWGIEDLLNGNFGNQNFLTLFYSLPEIFAPVNEIASRVAEANWQLKSFSNDDVDYKNKTFNKLFSQPNILMSFKEFVWQAVCYEILTGANFQYFNKPNTLSDSYENTLGWFNMPTQNVFIDKNKSVDIYSATVLSDLIKGYEVRDNSSTSRKMDAKNVLPFLNLDLKCGNDIDKYKSRLSGAYLAIKNLIPVYEARGVIYVKRGALGFLVSKKSDQSGLISLTPKEKEEAQKAYQETYGLRRDKNQISVSSAPVEYISTSMSIQELQPFDETLADATAIYATLRVPKHFIPSKNQSTFANANSDEKAFYQDVIIPMANKYAQAWTTYFNIPNRYIHADYSHISALKENEKDKAEVDSKNSSTYLQRWQNGLITLNDWIGLIDGEKGTGDIYEKKIFDLSPENVDLVKNIINLKTNAVTPKDTGIKAKS